MHLNVHFCSSQFNESLGDLIMSMICSIMKRSLKENLIRSNHFVSFCWTKKKLVTKEKKMMKETNLL